MSYDSYVGAQSSQHRQQMYNNGADYDPYGQSPPQPHSTYDDHPAPYKDEGALPPATMADNEFDVFQPPSKSTGDLRMWRHDHHGNLWTKGGRGRCIGRFCCCTIMTTLLLFISILLTLAAFLRPPDIQFGGISPVATNAVGSSSTELTADLGIGISVTNPNFFTVTFQSIEVNVTYPINNTPVGGGVDKNLVFKSNSKTSFTYPFTFRYSLSSDPNGTIITDIATKCGFLPGFVKQPLTVRYTLTLALQVAGVTIRPPFSGNAQFDCPFTQSDITPFISNISGLSSILGSSNI